MLPTVDFCFKELMQNPTVRQGFIAALLGVPPEEVAETVLLPTLLSGGMPEEKTGILDVHIRLSSGAQMDMEMQVSYFPHWEKRVLFYLGRMYTGQLKKGESYTDLKKCIHVSILDFNHFPDDQECYRTMHFRNDLTGDLYTDLLEIQVLELRKPLPSSRGQNTVSDWIEFLRGKNREERDGCQRQTSIWVKLMRHWRNSVPTSANGWNTRPARKLYMITILSNSIIRRRGLRRELR